MLFISAHECGAPVALIRNAAWTDSRTHECKRSSKPGGWR